MEEKRKTRTWQAAAAFAWVAAAGGCSIGGGSSAELPLEPASTFSRPGQAPLEARWWTRFGDERLNALIDEGLADNFSLEAAWRRVQAADAVARREGAALFPRLDGVAGASRRRPEGPESGDRFRAGLAADYELDLWGRARAASRAADFASEASLEDYRSAAMSLSAEIARAWFGWNAATLQHRLLERQLEANRQALDLIESRFEAGQLRSVDVLRQRQLIESTLEQVYLSETRIQVLEHLLLILIGRQPQESLGYEAIGLPKLPELPATGLPAELVMRRPDLRAAYWDLRAAEARAAEAAAARFPRLTLSGELISEGEEVDAVFDDWIRGVAADVVAPLFAGGALSAESRRAKAVLEQRLAEYGQAALEAFRSVEDALAQEQGQLRRLASLREQERLADRSYQQLRVEYFNGVATYIEVLTALTGLQQIQRDLLDAELAAWEFRVALHRALGGGFETEREQEES